jgi:PRC-barrel domain
MYSSDFSFFDKAAAEKFVGREVVDQRGERIGVMAAFWLDPSTFRAAYIGVKSSSFPHHCHVVPAADSHVEGNGTIRISYPADQIKRAPIAQPGFDLAQVEKEEANAHYERSVPLKRITSIEETRPEEALGPQDDRSGGPSKKSADVPEDRSEIAKDEQSFFEQEGFVSDSMPEVDVSEKLQ